MVKIKKKVALEPKAFLVHLLKKEETEVELDGYTFDYNEENYSFDPEITANEVISYDAHSGTFTVEVEEELTENTVLPSVVVVRTQYFPNNGHSVNVAKINSKSIKQVIENQPNNSKFEYHSIYLMESERIGQLIWKDGELVGDK